MREGRWVALLWSVVARLPSFQSLPNLHVHTASTYVNVECCGMCMCFRNKGRDRVEKGFHFQLFQKQCGGGL